MPLTYGGYLDPNTQRLTGPGWQTGAPYTQNQTPPPPSQNNQQGPPPSQNNPPPTGSMYSQGSGFSIGRNPNQGGYVPGASTGIRGGMSPKIKESLAKNAMISDLFGGYSEWKAAGSPDLGDQWKRYSSVIYNRDGNWDRLRQQGDLRGLPSREDMLAQLGVGQTQQPQQPPPSPLADPRAALLNRQDPSVLPYTPPGSDPMGSYNPTDANWVYNNIYGQGGWQPPQPWGPHPAVYSEYNTLSRPFGQAQTGGLPNTAPGAKWQGNPPPGPSGLPYHPTQRGLSDFKGGQTLPVQTEQLASTQPSVTGTQFSGGKGGGKGGSAPPSRRGGYT